jgi:hypothetical protein
MLEKFWPGERLIGLVQIAKALGWSRSTLQRKLRASGVRLSKIGRRGKTSNVWIGADQLKILRRRLLASSNMNIVAGTPTRTPKSQHGTRSKGGPPPFSRRSL